MISDKSEFRFSVESRREGSPQQCLSWRGIRRGECISSVGASPKQSSPRRVRRAEAIASLLRVLDIRDMNSNEASGAAVFGCDWVSLARHALHSTDFSAPPCLVCAQNILRRVQCVLRLGRLARGGRCGRRQIDCAMVSRRATGPRPSRSLIVVDLWILEQLQSSPSVRTDRNVCAISQWGRHSYLPFLKINSETALARTVA